MQCSLGLTEFPPIMQMAPIPTAFQKKFFATTRLLAQVNESIQQAPETRIADNLPSIRADPPSAKFLDMLAKIFAHRTQKGHVYATVFVRSQDGRPKVYLANNRGIGKMDLNLAHMLCMWLQGIAECNVSVPFYNNNLLNSICKHNAKVVEDLLSTIAGNDASEVANLCKDPEATAKACYLDTLCTIWI